MKNKNQQISIIDRIQNEQESYDKGLDRKKYNSAFGHAQSGYSSIRKSKMFADVLKEEKGKVVLEIGSTAWKKYIDFEQYAPSELVCINISKKELEKGEVDSKKMNVDKYCKHAFKIMDAHDLEFPDETFDIVFGMEILHHFDFEVAIKEIARVLKKGGKIAFSEPLEKNPVGKLVRKLTPNKRTAYEKPLNKNEIDILSDYFDLDLSYHQLLYVPAGAISKYLFKSPNNPLTYIAHKMDLFVEKIFRKTNMGLYFRQIVIKGEKK